MSQDKMIDKKLNAGFKEENDIKSQTKSQKNNKKQKSQQSKNTGIPKYVADRMAKRIAIATGIPTLAGMGVFIGSYILISKGIADISPSLTLTISAGCFFVGLLGLSYGILSASWDVANGSILGIENIKPNINRMKDAFKTKE